MPNERDDGNIIISMIIQRQSSRPLPPSPSPKERERCFITNPNFLFFHIINSAMPSKLWSIQSSGLCVGGLPFGKVGMGLRWPVLVVIKWKSPLLELYPIEILRRHTVFFHSNTISNRANKFAEIAADTFLFFYRVSVVRVAKFQVDALV